MSHVTGDRGRDVYIDYTFYAIDLMTTDRGTTEERSHRIQVFQNRVILTMVVENRARYRFFSVSPI